MNVVEYSSRRRQWETEADSCNYTKVFSNSVENLFCKLKIFNSVTIIWITCIGISSHFLFIFELLCPYYYFYFHVFL